VNQAETAFQDTLLIAELTAFDRLQTPIWIFDIQKSQMWWANKAALYIWNAKSREELLNRDFSEVSESTQIRLQSYLHQFQQGKTISENWTFYPQEKPVSVRCLCSGIEIEPGRMAMLVEGTIEVVNQIDRETLRSIEAMRHTTLMISLYTIEGVPLMQNPAALRCYGDTLHPNSSTENAFLRHFVDPKIAQQAMEAIQLGEVLSIETQVFTTQGIRAHGMDIRSTRDPVTGNLMLLVNEKDISDRQELEKSFHLSDFSFEFMAAAATWIAKDARILRVNESACRMLGYSRTELQSMRVYDLDPNFPQEKWPEHWQELKQQKNITFISQHQRKDGQFVQVQITLNYLEFNGEEYNFAFSQDISDRLQAEAALRESEQRYRSVIATMAEGIVLQQADGQITACNESAEIILGLSVDQMMGLTSVDPRWQAIHEDGSPFPGENHPAMVTLRTGEPQFQVVMGVRKPNGSLTWITVNSQPLFRLDQPQPYAVVTSFTDITVTKLAEQALRQQAERERMIYAIAQHIRQSLDLDEILNTTVAEVRHFLQADRVIIYRFNPDWSGVVFKESVADASLAILDMGITDTYFVESKINYYQQNTIKITSDIYEAGFDTCHVELLERLQVRAKLVVPILQSVTVNNRLSSDKYQQENPPWGLLIAHHCHAPRKWHPLESELLNQLAAQIAIAIQQSELHQQLQIANQKLQTLVIVDQLTQIGNRRCFDDKLNQEWHRLMREQQPLSLLLCDIDYFKKYNDTYGHIAGDICLQLVAQIFKKAVQRSTDLAARYGGEEFAVILPNTDSNVATKIAQKIHAAIHQRNISHKASAVKPYVTLSIGIATLIPQNNIEPRDLIEAADKALYQAKAQGRDRSFIAISN
jgi:diguanylate cyclase (GGDEF)-like protein/PAS domain S-box-containing protein